MADSIDNLSDLQMNKSSLSNEKSPDIDDADCIEGQIDYFPNIFVSSYDHTKTLRRRAIDKAYKERKLDKSKRDREFTELMREISELMRELDESRRENGELRWKLAESRRENDESSRKLDIFSLGDECLKIFTTDQQLMCFHTDQMNELISSKKKFTNIDDADCFGGQAYQGANTLNLGMQTGTSSGDIDQTAAGQLSAVKPGKRLQKEIDQNYHKRTKVIANVGDMKSKLVQGKEISMELQKVKQESEQLKKFSEWFDQRIQKDAKSMEEFQSQISSLISINGSQNQHIHSFFLRLLDMYGEKDKLQKEVEYLKKLMTEQQPVAFDTNQVSREN